MLESLIDLYTFLSGQLIGVEDWIRSSSDSWNQSFVDIVSVVSVVVQECWDVRVCMLTRPGIDGNT